MVSPRRLIQFLLVLFTAGLVLPGRLRGSAFSVPYSNAHALRGGRWIPGRCAKGLRLSASPIVEAWLLQQERDKEYDELLRGGFSKDGLQRDEFWRSKPLLGEVVAKAKAITPRKNRFLDWEKKQSFGDTWAQVDGTIRSMWVKGMSKPRGDSAICFCACGFWVATLCLEGEDVPIFQLAAPSDPPQVS